MNASAASHRLPRLQTRLQVWILGALVVVWASFVFWGYQAGVEEADELTDGHLASVAKARRRRAWRCRACAPMITSSP